MSANPSGSSGQPRASAIGRGIAITRGVSWNDTKSPAMAGSPCAARRSLSTEPQVDAAGDQITGRGPSRSSSQPVGEELGGAAATTSTAPAANTHSPPTSASLSLKSWASRVSRSSFSGDTERSATTQSPGSPRSGTPSSPPRRRRRASEQAAASRPSASSPAVSADGSRCGSRGHVPPERVQGGHHARLQRRGEVVLASVRPPGVLERSPGPRRCRAAPSPPVISAIAMVAATGTSGSIVSTPRSSSWSATARDRAGRRVGARASGQGRALGSASPSADGSARLASQALELRRTAGRWPRSRSLPKNPADAEARTGRPSAEVGVGEPDLQLSPAGVRAVARASAQSVPADPPRHCQMSSPAQRSLMASYRPGAVATVGR